MGILRCRREQGGACLPDHPLFIRTLQITFELDDCDETSHCLSIVPESVEEKQRLATTSIVDAQVIRPIIRHVLQERFGADTARSWL